MDLRNGGQVWLGNKISKAKAGDFFLAVDCRELAVRDGSEWLQVNVGG